MAFRYRDSGRGSRRVQRDGFASKRDASEALERALERLRRERGRRKRADARRVRQRLRAFSIHSAGQGACAGQIRYGAALVTNGPLPGHRSNPATGVVLRSIKRTAPAVIILCLAAALVATPAPGDPSITSKQAEAQSVMNQVQGLDASLERTVEAYNFATVQLNQVRRELKANHAQLRIAKQSLKRAQSTLSARLVQLYTSGGQSDSLEVLLGASSLDDLVNRVNTANRISAQDTRMLTLVTRFDKEVKAREARLKHAKFEAAALVSKRASERASIEGQLSARHALLSSIRGEIAHLKEQEAARQAKLRRELAARIANQQKQALATALSTTADPVAPAPAAAPAPTPAAASAPTPAADPAPTPAPAQAPTPAAPPAPVTTPPPTHSSVVSIAMRYLGVPYRWGGASPSGFDCSGLAMYVFAQVGVSLPHSSYAQYGMGSAVSRDQLQPGDLVFFDGLGHVGIYVGGGSFIHAPHTGDVVKISSMTGWYASMYVGARRV